MLRFIDRALRCSRQTSVQTVPSKLRGTSLQQLYPREIAESQVWGVQKSVVGFRKVQVMRVALKGLKSGVCDGCRAQFLRSCLGVDRASAELTIARTSDRRSRPCR